MPVILALGKQGQTDLCEFKVSLVYELVLGQAPMLQRNPVLEPHPPSQKKERKKKKKKKELPSLIL